ncbi:MAG: bifunctional DNA primase/polymerase [Bacteroidetes bacterium]|nr:bifunctional DNA primase/polymerase [Bacteroidota bacterium]
MKSNPITNEAIDSASLQQQTTEKKLSGDLIYSTTKYIENGLSCIPVGDNKNPLIPWKQYQKKLMPIEEVRKNFNKASNIGVICGIVSGNLEVIDVDCKHDITGSLWEDFSSLINEILPDLFPKLVVASTKNSGYHIIYKCDEIGWNKPIAKRPPTSGEKENGDTSNKVLIETRGEGGYVVVHPSRGYKFIQHNLDHIPRITPEERSKLLSIAKSFNEVRENIRQLTHTKSALSNDKGLSPFEDYNQRGNVLELLQNHKWKIVRDDTDRIHLRRPGKEDGISANFHKGLNTFYCFSTSTEFEAGKAYDPVGVYNILEADEDFKIASKQLKEQDYGDDFSWSSNNKSQVETSSDEIPYIRVGDNYYKETTRVRANGSLEASLQPINRQTIIDDHYREYLKKIPRYDAFCCVPNHANYQRVIGTNYNSYSPLEHTPFQYEEPVNSIKMVRHIFGGQYELGLDYFKLLYEKPDQILPVLCLVSKENGTGKTTALNWLHMIFGDNMVILGNQELNSQFNGMYANKLIIAVDESRIEKNTTLDRVKSLATAKTIVVNDKYIKPYPIDFFGKIILCSNYEDTFIQANEEDIRYWVIKLNKPEEINYNIEDELRKEIPSFLAYLQKRKLHFKTKQSRMWFDPKDIYTPQLAAIRESSKSVIYKELYEVFEDFFYNEGSGLKLVEATPKDIKERFFRDNHKIESHNIIRALKSDFGLRPTEKSKKYNPFGSFESKTGRPYLIKRELFVKDEELQTELFVDEIKNPME